MDHFGSLSGHFWRMKVTLEPLWGHFGVTFGIEGDFGTALESPLVYDGNFAAALGSLRRHFWYVKATLRLLWFHFSYMMVTLWQLWGHWVVAFGI